MTTFLDGLVAALKGAGAYAKDDQVARAAILWPDSERQWEPFIPALRDRLPLLTYGPYDPILRTGPSYWLRCMVERTLDDAIPAGETPILYLPGMSWSASSMARTSCYPPVRAEPRPSMTACPEPRRRGRLTRPLPIIAT